MRIAVIGATGYLGAHLSEAIARRGHQVFAWGRRSNSVVTDWAGQFSEYRFGDVTDDKVIQSIVEQAPELIIYLVALDHKASEGSLREAISINVMPLAALLAKITNELPDCRIVYLSSAQVYGQHFERVSETCIPNPSNNYGLTHLMAEQIVTKFSLSSQARSINVRLSNGYGAPIFEDANCWWLVANDFCKAAHERHEIVLKSDGSPKRNFIHVEDIVRGLVYLASSDKGDFPSLTLNLGGLENVSIFELARLVAKIHDERYAVPVRIRRPARKSPTTSKGMRKCDQFFFDTSKIVSLGFSPELSLEQGINKVFDYFDRQGARN